jgi:hypothetical protein
MGLLDDAIREHLDLKRKHGAGEDELRRQEGEALGPARRDFAADAARDAEPEAEAAPAAEPEPARAELAGWLDDEPGGAPFDAEPPSREAPEPVAEAETVAQSTDLAEPAELAEPLVESETESTRIQEPLPAPDPAPAAEPPPAPERRESDTPTQGFPAISRDDEPPAEGDEDVLEETPDFLQDTPEHDRLWFEQKPPRDFDFDG